MMQLRCEPAVTQGLRSDVLQATKMLESAGLHPKSPFPLALWLWTSPRLRPASLPITFSASLSKYALNHIEVFTNPTFPKHVSVLERRIWWRWFLLLTGVECEPVWSGKCWRDIGLQLVYLATENAQQRNVTYASKKVTQNAVWQLPHDARAWTCCACITGTITYRKCPTSEVVK